MSKKEGMSEAEARARAALMNFTDEQKQLRARIRAANFSDFAEYILLSSCRGTDCGYTVCFRGNDEIADRAEQERMEKEINESGVATIRFEGKFPWRRPVVTFLPGDYSSPQSRPIEIDPSNPFYLPPVEQD